MNDDWRSIDGRRLGVFGVLVLAQAVLFYNHFAVALTVLFGMAIGVWLRHWSAAIWALLAFLLAFLLAVATGWLHDARPFAEPILGGLLAVLGGLIGGGIFQVLASERPVQVAERTEHRTVTAQPLAHPE